MTSAWDVEHNWSIIDYQKHVLTIQLKNCLFSHPFQLLLILLKNLIMICQLY